VIRRSHQQGVVLVDKAADGIHVPNVVLVDVHRAFRGHHVERSKADIPQRIDWPAVVPIRPGELVSQILAELVPLEQRADVNASCKGILECADRPSQAHPGRCSNRRILLTYELQRLGRPRHQLAIEADPLRVESLPELGTLQRIPNEREQLPLQHRILKEPTTRAGVADAMFVLEDSESFARDVVISTNDQDGS
jgi:hypothetical protein